VHESRPEIRLAPLALAPALLPPVGLAGWVGTAYTSYSIGRKLSSYLEQPTDARTAVSLPSGGYLQLIGGRWVRRAS
jgi:hypothetical protein